LRIGIGAVGRDRFQATRSDSRHAFLLLDKIMGGGN
jgi:hypothetical protein